MKQLDQFFQPLLNMGEDMSSFTVIRVSGQLHKHYIGALRQFESSYGDCSFEKTNKTDVRSDGYDWQEYSWNRREVPAAAIRDKDLTDAAEVMRAFVPALSFRYIKAMQDAGLDVSLLGQGRSN